MQFPDREDANFLMVCDSGSAAAYFYAPHPKYDAASPRVSRPDGADALSCAFAVAQKSSRASAAHDWRCIVASNDAGDPPSSHPRCRVVSPPCDELSQSGILRIAQDAPVQRALAIRSHAESCRNADTDSF